MYTKELLELREPTNFDLPLNTDYVTPSKIFDMVVKGLPINGLARAYPEDEVDGINENASDEEDFNLLDEVESKHVYFDDDLEMAQYVGDTVIHAPKESPSPKESPAPEDSSSSADPPAPVDPPTD